MVQTIFRAEDTTVLGTSHVKVNISKEGKLHIEGQEYSHRVKLLSGKEFHLLSSKKQKLIQEFFEDFLKEYPIDWKKGALGEFTLTLEPSGEVKAEIIQRDNTLQIKEKSEIGEIVLPSISKLIQMQKLSAVPIPLLQITQVKESSLVSSIGHLFKGLVELLFGKEVSLSREIVYEFKQLVKHFPIKIQKDIFYQLSQLTEDERAIVRFLRENLDLTGLDEKQVMTHILSGAYVVLDDEGQTYQQLLSKLKSSEKRISSHESDDAQYAVRGPFVKEFLFSRKRVRGAGKVRTVSWFQLERYPSKFGYYLRHLWTFVLYKIYKENQGPWGSSIYTEKNPLILKLRSSDKE